MTADLACGVCVQDLVFDDKPQPLPGLFTALWPLQIPTHRGICVRRHLEDNTIMIMFEVVTAGHHLAPQRRRIGHLFQCCRYFLLLPDESQSGFIPRGHRWRQGLLTWRPKRKLSIISAFPVPKNTRMSERIYCSVAEEQGNTGHTHALAGFSGTRGSICWKNKTGTPPDKKPEKQKPLHMN